MSQDALTNTEANRQRIARVETLLDQVWRETLRRGYYGTVGIEWDVKDGTISEVRELSRRHHR